MIRCCEDNDFLANEQGCMRIIAIFAAGICSKKSRRVLGVLGDLGDLRALGELGEL